MNWGPRVSVLIYSVMVVVLVVVMQVMQEGCRSIKAQLFADCVAQVLLLG